MSPSTREDLCLLLPVLRGWRWGVGALEIQDRLNPVAGVQILWATQVVWSWAAAWTRAG